MSRVTIPLNAPNPKTVSGLRELARIESQAEKLQQQEAVRANANEFKDRMDGWIDVAKRYDQRDGDHAQQKPGLIVLSHEKTVVGNGQTSWYGDLSAEVKPGSAFVQIDDTEIRYRQKGGQEVYSETSEGTTTRLSLDHKRGTLTFTTP